MYCVLIKYFASAKYWKPNVHIRTTHTPYWVLVFLPCVFVLFFHISYSTTAAFTDPPLQSPLLHVNTFSNLLALLRGVQVIDYSVLVALDYDKGEITVGIIDYVRMPVVRHGGHWGRTLCPRQRVRIFTRRAYAWYVLRLGSSV